MPRKRLTQVFPWLLPLRKKQRELFFYAGMRLDGVHYSKSVAEDIMPHRVFETEMPLYNTSTGFDMVYQENKVFNLKLAAATLHKLVIRPGETFSFWQRVRHADRETPYKDGLVMVNGKLETSEGGGLCQMSNLLYWLFLHTPLTTVERKGHVHKDFPDPGDAVKGADATVSEGWIDLKVKNNTNASYQVLVWLDEENIYGAIAVKEAPAEKIVVTNGEVTYCAEAGKVLEEAPVYATRVNAQTGEELQKELLYVNRCIVTYPLPGHVAIQGEEYLQASPAG